MKPNLLPPPLATGAIDLLQEMLFERGAIRTDFTLYQDQRRNLLVPEQGKCDADAARFHNTGYIWTGSMRKLWSAVYYEQGEHCTTSILPRSMIIRKSCCKQQIAAGRSKGTVPSPRMDINVDTHPKIPFLAKGIKVNHRRILVAEKDFNPGDKLWHQFECSVATKLRNFSNFNLLSTPRLFLYGLSLFDDNLAELKRFCEANEGAELKRFELDYSNLDRRELFRILHNTVARRDPIGELNGYLEEKLISYGYFLVFQANPLMVTVTTGRRNFTIQTLNKLARLQTTLLSNNRDFLGRIISWIFPAIPANIHTCEPNAHTAFESGTDRSGLVDRLAIIGPAGAAA
ncbi:hypothetical protein quinque_008486 [Culex quinquefasciatus]